MLQKLEAITNNGKSGKDYKEYNKILYWCVKDDIWISIETPLIHGQGKNLVQYP